MKRSVPKKVVLNQPGLSKPNSASNQCTSKQSFNVQNGKTINLKLKRNQKSKSNDTLVSDSSASSEANVFLDILNRNASKIQIWYRETKRRQLKESISTLEIKELNIEQDASKRRQLIADSTREVNRSLLV